VSIKVSALSCRSTVSSSSYWANIWRRKKINWWYNCIQKTTK